MRASFGLDAGTDGDRGNDNDEQVFVFIYYYPYHMDPRQKWKFKPWNRIRQELFLLHYCTQLFFSS
jgi:hypothetical protein